MRYYAVINDSINIQLFSWNLQNFKATQQLHVISNDINFITQNFVNIDTLKIYGFDSILVAIFTEYDGYNAISYEGSKYNVEVGGIVDELVVTLSKISIAKEVEKLNEKINNVIDTSTMTLEELKEYKIKEMSKQGEELIFAGTDITLIDGTVKNFTYNLEDQSNLLNALFIIQTLDDLTITLPYHGHAEPCELYSALNIIAIYINLQIYSTTIQTLVNMRNNWIRTMSTKEEVLRVTFETELPIEWQQRAQAILEPSMELVDELRRKYFPQNGE